MKGVQEIAYVEVTANDNVADALRRLTQEAAGKERQGSKAVYAEIEQVIEDRQSPDQHELKHFVVIYRAYYQDDEETANEHLTRPP